MRSFVLRRFLQMLLVCCVLSVACFAVIRFAPGDPLYIYMTPGATGHRMTDQELQRMRDSLGLSGTLTEQYLSWLKKALQGDFGFSLSNREPVLDQILEKLPCTAGLMGVSLLIALTVAIPLGIWAGTRKNTPADGVISAITYLGISVPAFWLGIMMIVLFSLKLRWFPSSGMRTIGLYSSWDVIRHRVLPAAVLSLGNMAVFVRYIRANTIDQLEEEYVQTALAKGLSQRRVFYGHVLRNCLLPVITVVGARLGTLVTGSFIVESVFAWPGLGTLGMSAINNRDYPMIMAIALFSCLFLQMGNFLADLLYCFVDPRIQRGGENHG